MKIKYGNIFIEDNKLYLYSLDLNQKYNIKENKN